MSCGGGDVIGRLRVVEDMDERGVCDRNSQSTAYWSPDQSARCVIITNLMDARP